MLPVPRTMDASVLRSQITIAPVSPTLAYRTACSRTGPLPPSVLRIDRPNSANSSEKPRPARSADRQRMHGKCGRALAVAGAERAADGRRDAAAHRAGRQHLHQHDEGKDQRDGSQLRGAEDAHVDGLENRHQCGDEHGRQIGRSQAQERRQDRARRAADWPIGLRSPSGRRPGPWRRSFLARLQRAETARISHPPGERRVALAPMPVRPSAIAMLCTCNLSINSHLQKCNLWSTVSVMAATYGQSARSRGRWM